MMLATDLFCQLLEAGEVTARQKAFTQLSILLWRMVVYIVACPL